MLTFPARLESPEAQFINRMPDTTHCAWHVVFRYRCAAKIVNFNLLQDPYIVYETGAWDKKDWTDAQKLPKSEIYIMLHSIESFGIMK